MSRTELCITRNRGIRTTTDRRQQKCLSGVAWRHDWPCVLRAARACAHQRTQLTHIYIQRAVCLAVEACTFSDEKDAITFSFCAKESYGIHIYKRQTNRWFHEQIRLTFTFSYALISVYLKLCPHWSNNEDHFDASCCCISDKEQVIKILCPHWSNIIWGIIRFCFGLKAICCQQHECICYWQQKYPETWKTFDNKLQLFRETWNSNKKVVLLLFQWRQDLRLWNYGRWISGV